MVAQALDVTGVDVFARLRFFKRHGGVFPGWRFRRGPSSTADADKAPDGLAGVAPSHGENVFEQLIAAANAGATHDEIRTCLPP